MVRWGVTSTFAEFNEEFPLQNASSRVIDHTDAGGKYVNLAANKNTTGGALEITQSNPEPKEN